MENGSSTGIKLATWQQKPRKEKLPKIWLKSEEEKPSD
jgi:hypothetical protein